MTAPTDLLRQVDLATERLLATCRGLTDADVAGPSLLPGWARGHVMTHVARNADSLVNLLTWARTGVVTPQYASAEAREADIAAGAPRPVAEQVADLEAAAERFRTAADAMPGPAWDAVVYARAGNRLPARDIPWARLRDVAVHHVDLGAGYTPADWPEEFVARLLPEAVADFSERDGVPAVTVRAGELTATIGAGEPERTVTGDPSAVLAWLIGRGDAGLAVTPSGPPPRLPAWR